MSPRASFPDELVEQAFTILRNSSKTNPVKSKELDRLFSTEDADGHPRSRDLIYHVIRKKRMPIGADTNGYYIIRTYEELQEYAQNLDYRSTQIEYRKNLIMFYFGQQHPDLIPDDEELKEPDDNDEVES